MSNFNNDLVKHVVKVAREETDLRSLKNTHVHELVASSLGYKSKAALDAAISAGQYLPDCRDYNPISEYSYGPIADTPDVTDQLDQRISKLNLPITPSEVINSLNEVWPSKCQCPDCNELDTFIFQTLDDDHIYICEECADKRYPKKGNCRFCFNYAELTPEGECSVHKGESQPYGEAEIDARNHFYDRLTEGLDEF